MCGIYGITDRNTKFVNNYINTCSYRGPNGSQVWGDDHVTLGHNLLNVTDDVENSMQPWITNKGNVLIYNGEIFNYNELVKQYQDFVPKTKCDTELLAWGLDKFGTAFVEKIDSMHAFVYYDRNDCSLTLSRDHAGIKPLYYAQIKKGLVFGSEIKGLLDIVPSAKQSNPYALKALELVGVNPLRETFFNNINRVLPGESIRFDIRNNRIARVHTNLIKPSCDHKFDSEEFRHIMAMNIKQMTTGIRKIGARLSGGLDSCIMSYEASKHVDNLEVFTNRYDPCVEEGKEDFHSDHELAEMFANKYGLQFNTVTGTPKEYADLYTNAVWHQEEPVYNMSLPIYFQMFNAMKQKDIVVSLAGDLGDEMLCGYVHHLKLQSNQHKSYRDLVSNQLFSFIRHPQSIDQNLPDKHDVVEKFLSQFEENNFWIENDNCASFQMLETLTYAANEYFQVSDRYGMAHGMESRFPFASKMFMRYSMSIPSKDKLIGKARWKVLPRNAYKNILPDYIINKPKTGWDSPAHHWFKDKTLLRRYSKSLTNNRHIPHWLTREWLSTFDMKNAHNPNPNNPTGPRLEVTSRNDVMAVPL